MHFFDQLPGAADSVISDQDSSIAGALRRVWPQTEHLLCEHHLMQRIRDRIDPYFLNQPQHPIMVMLPYCLSSIGGWDRFRQAVLDEYHQGNSALINGSGLMKFVLTVGPNLILPQIQTRTQLGPNSVGAVETAQRTIADYLKHRSSNMTNVERARKLMLLIRAGLNGEANELLSSERIRLFLEQRNGRPLNQRQWRDSAGYWSLLA